MRAIKFRAWSKSEKRMYHNVEQNKWCLYQNSFGEVLRSDDFDVMQFTGLLDKNGKDIYEGDIVRVINYLDGKEWEGHCHNDFIIFSKGGFDLKSPWAHESLKDNEVEVLGNIYETPELMNFPSTKLV